MPYATKEARRAWERRNRAKIAAAQRWWRARNAGVCSRCGGPTSASEGLSKRADTCATCTRQQQHDDRKWNPESIVTALKAWASDHDGMAPSSAAWLPRMPEGMPPVSVVQREFGSWSAGLRAAGLEPRGAGRPRKSV
jgi:Homing endonuclease associated repeat